MMKDMDAPSWIANLGISLFAAPMLFLGPIGGRFTQNVGPFKASIGGLTAGAFILTMYGVLPSPYPMLVFGVMHGIVDGLTVTGGSTAIAMIVPEARIASAQGMQGATQTVIAGIASVVAGVAYGAFGRTTTFVSAAGIMLLLIAVGTWMVKDHIHMKGTDGLDPVSASAVEPLL
jgi:MFS family permease